jgi:hypothetical protein
VYTEIAPFTEFYLAETYHQKHSLQQVSELFQEFQSIYPDEGRLINSTATMRVNGYLGGHGTLAQLEEEIGDLGLSPAAQSRLLEIVAARER